MNAGGCANCTSRETCVKLIQEFRGHLKTGKSQNCSHNGILMIMSECCTNLPFLIYLVWFLTLWKMHLNFENAVPLTRMAKMFLKYMCPGGPFKTDLKILILYWPFLRAFEIQAWETKLSFTSPGSYKCCSHPQSAYGRMRAIQIQGIIIITSSLCYSHLALYARLWFHLLRLLLNIIFELILF